MHWVSKSSKMALDLTQPPLAWLCRTWAFAHVGEYAQAVCALAPTFLRPPSTETITTLCHLDPFAEVDLTPFVNDFHPKMDLILDRKTFICILTHFPHLSSNNPSGMVYELLRDYFVPNDSTNGFDLFLKICKHITCGHVPSLISHLLITSWLITLEKQIENIQPITIGEVIYQLVTHTLAI